MGEWLSWWARGSEQCTNCEWRTERAILLHWSILIIISKCYVPNISPPNPSSLYRSPLVFLEYTVGAFVIYNGKKTKNGCTCCISSATKSENIYGVEEMNHDVSDYSSNSELQPEPTPQTPKRKKIQNGARWAGVRATTKSSGETGEVKGPHPVG